MPELPVISGREAVKVFGRLGFRVVRQKGSHMVLRRGGAGCVVPDHRDLALGTLRSAIRQAGITVDEFVAEYRNG